MRCQPRTIVMTAKIHATPRALAVFALSGLMDGWSYEKRETAIAQVSEVIKCLLSK